MVVDLTGWEEEAAAQAASEEASRAASIAAEEAASAARNAARKAAYAVKMASMTPEQISAHNQQARTSLLGGSSDITLGMRLMGFR